MPRMPVPILTDGWFATAKAQINTTLSGECAAKMQTTQHAVHNSWLPCCPQGGSCQARVAGSLGSRRGIPGWQSCWQSEEGIDQPQPCYRHNMIPFAVLPKPA